jgi:hypothetical protein
MLETRYIFMNLDDVFCTCILAHLAAILQYCCNTLRHLYPSNKFRPRVLYAVAKKGLDRSDAPSGPNT